MVDEGSDDERDVELSSIAAIYPELIIDPEEPHSADLYLTVAPTEAVSATFQPPFNGTSIYPTPPSSDSVEPRGSRPEVPDAPDTHLLRYLPPLHLHITLPVGYPDQNPPQFRLDTSPNWLDVSTIKNLEKYGLELWEEYGRSQVVFAYIVFLQQEAENAFRAETVLHALPYKFREPMLAFDKQMNKTLFDQEIFDCGVCLDPKKGSECYRLRGCGHVFCIGCLQDFYNSAITDGDVSSVKCLAPDCGAQPGNRRGRKKPRSLHPSELLEIPLERSQAQRYVQMKVKKKLESDKSTIYCPRKFCQAPARSVKYAKYETATIDDFPDSDDELSNNEAEEAEADRNNQQRDQVQNHNASTSKPPPDRLAICSKCSFAFCRICERSWHGELINCLPPSEKIDQLSTEDKASYDYIRMNTSPCPTCESPCQKTHGCNHMQCFTCNTHFCYLCSSWLFPANPYQHFNQQGSGCYMRLWELEEGDEGQGRPAIFGGARAAEQQAVAFAAQFEEGNGAGEANVARQGDAANARAANNERGAGDRGLQRFLEMAANDEEDGWDSDEMDDEWFH